MRLDGASVLVTGGTGTFGRAYIRALLQRGTVKRVIAYSRDEVKHAALQEEFREFGQFRLFLGDVRDCARLTTAMRDVDVVVHAAALKRVDQGAYSPSEMIATNVLGTMNVVNAAIAAHVERVLVISSDKAVEATNIYGATKFCAEVYAVQSNSYGGRLPSEIEAIAGYLGGPVPPRATRIAAVRYGNVLASRGSVIYRWQEQSSAGLPLTITHPDMSRFIMTIEQAVLLVDFALTTMHGGEVFVPVLPSARMMTLAAAVALKGADGDFPVQTVGLRPGGEKMAEALLNEEEPSRTYRSGDYYVVTPSNHEWTDGAHWQAMEKVDPDFSYRSDVNDRWLSASELAEMLATTEAAR